MQEHVGKKRRKEVREAIDMRNQLRSTIVVITVALVISLAVVLGIEALVIVGTLAYDSFVVQFLPIIVFFILLFAIGTKAYRFSGLRSEYKEHCKKYNITKEDMHALERGDL